MRFYLSATAAFLAAVAAGCSSNPTAELNMGGELTGTVFLGDAPLPGGRLELWPETGRHNAGCELGPKGEYRIPDPPLGPCKVVIKNDHLRSTPQPPKAGAKTKEGSSAGMILPNDVGFTFKPIPTKYASEATTDLRVTVKEGKQQEDIRLRPK